MTHVTVRMAVGSMRSVGHGAAAGWASAMTPSRCPRPLVLLLVVTLSCLARPADARVTLVMGDTRSALPADVRLSRLLQLQDTEQDNLSLEYA